MLFQSWIFLPFFLISFLGYLLLRKTRVRFVWLLFCSYVFYAWLSPYFLAVLIASTAVDFYAVKWMENSRHKKRWVVFSVICHVLLLGFFKYGYFVSENINALLAWLNVGVQMGSPNALLPKSLHFVFPAGISFYTFQAMSYTIDFYRGVCRRERSFVRFATFVSFFPRVLAGPIERARHLLPQMEKEAAVGLQDLTDGASLFLVGLFKKVAIADVLARYVAVAYDNPAGHDGGTLALATFAFAWQIYFDFSGYTDMARGVARCFGFKLMLNFNNPYLASSLGDFWRRWHISLSTWFRDYLYIPLGGNRAGKARTYLNLLITFVVSGLWHGAAWTFLIWGLIHGVFSVVTRELERSAFYREKVPRLAKQAMVFLIVSFAWIFFRASSLGDALLIVERIFGSAWGDPRFPLLLVAMVGVLWGHAFMYESRWRIWLEWGPVRAAQVVVMVLYLMFWTPAAGQGFIYLQF